MLLTLAFRHLLVRKLRSLFLLLGYALGVGVMIVLLSVGEALLDQSRDVSLVGGGEVTVLPEGIDVEALRTGGLGGMFFDIDRARFVTRQVIGGPRQRPIVAAVSPAIEGKLLYLRRGDRTVWVRAGADVPSRARSLGAGLVVTRGRWEDTPADSAWIAPTPQQLYDELDHFHLPAVDDSTWAEWYYFNLVTSPDEWWYLTFLVGGRIGHGQWGGQVLVSHRRPDGRYEQFTEPVPAGAVAFDTSRADLTLGQDRVRQRGGIYQVRIRRDRLAMDLVVRPDPNRYFPPLDLKDGLEVSGYVVPALSATASGRICEGAACRTVSGASAYHDHNWGVWRAVTWDWGAARGQRLGLLYGQVRTGDTESGGGWFLALADSLGILQVLRARAIDYRGTQPARGLGVMAPREFTLTGTREGDTVRVDVRVLEASASRVENTEAAGSGPALLQMRGRFRVSGRVAGRSVADSGDGFFETWREQRIGP